MSQLPSIKLTVNFIKERNQVIAYAPALDLSTVGKSEAQAKKRFEELVRIFLHDISKRQVTDKVLTELGRTKKSVQKRVLKSEWISREQYLCKMAKLWPRKQPRSSLHAFGMRVTGGGQRHVFAVAGRASSL